MGRRNGGERRFHTADWETLSVEQRVARCRMMAREAFQLADAATASLKETYLALAAEWEKLAQEIQQRSRD